MKAGHLYLSDDQYDLTNKSGIYTLFEHYQNVNDIQIKNIPIDTIYEDFKTNNICKYPYIYTDNITIFNNDNANCITAGLVKSIQPGQNVTNNIQYISFNILPKKDGNISFNIYNPNYSNKYQLDYCMTNYYGFYVNQVQIDLKTIYIDNPQSFNYLFSQCLYSLFKDVLYNIKFEFMSNLYYAIDSQDLCITDIIFPY